MNKYKKTNKVKMILDKLGIKPTDENPFNFIYAGLDENKLEEAIRKVVSK